MRGYSDLTSEEQRKAFIMALQDVLEQMCTGELMFDDTRSKGDVQARIDAALVKAEELETPWFGPELIFEAVKEEASEIAKGWAEESIYMDLGERAVYLGERSATLNSEDAPEAHPDTHPYPRGIGTA